MIKIKLAVYNLAYNLYDLQLWPMVTIVTIVTYSTLTEALRHCRRVPVFGLPNRLYIRLLLYYIILHVK